MVLSGNGNLIQQNLAFEGLMNSIATGLSMATNLLATVLIAYKLWLVNISCDLNDYCLFLTGARAIQVFGRNDGLVCKIYSSFS